jgi:hypothetical protein
MNLKISGKLSCVKISLIMRTTATNSDKQMCRQMDNNDDGNQGEGEVGGDDGHEGDYCNLQVPFW